MELYPAVELIRLEENPHYGTFGVLKINKEVFCVTLEPPDFLNELNRSSIPAQQYFCSKHDSPTFGSTYVVRHVPARSDILFHAGNLVDHTEGCILLAQHYGKLKGNRAILNSGETFNRFLNVMRPHHQFTLTIHEVY